MSQNEPRARFRTKVNLTEASSVRPRGSMQSVPRHWPLMSRRLPAAAGAPPRRLCVLPATTAEPWWCILSLRRLSNCRRTDVCRPDAAQSCRTDCSHVFTSRHKRECIRALTNTIPAREQLTRRLTLVADCSSATCLRQERMSKQVDALGQYVSCTSCV